jgi:hypothetical protein
MKAMTTTRFLLAAALAIASVALGCGSSSGPKQPRVEAQEADMAANNRLLVRMALAENVYNGLAAERAVYPKDFRGGTAMLNELGSRRVEMLIDACSGASGRVTVVRGEEPDDVYDARVATVRKHLADAGLSLEKVAVVKGGAVGGGGFSSDRATLTYYKMISSEAAKPGSGGGGASAMPMTPNLNQKGN